MCRMAIAVMAKHIHYGIVWMHQEQNITRKSRHLQDSDYREQQDSSGPAHCDSCSMWTRPLKASLVRFSPLKLDDYFSFQHFTLIRISLKIVMHSHAYSTHTFVGLLFVGFSV